MLGFIRILTCIVWILINEAYGKMVVNIEDLNTVSSDDIEKEATLVETFQRETACEGVMDHVKVFEFFIRDKGEDIRDTAEIVDRIVENKQQQVFNKNETWIQSTIILRADLNCLHQEDDTLISRLQSEYLHPPSTEEYNTSMITSMEPKSYSQFGQDMFLDKIVFKGQVKEGFFIEAGADDFVEHSNTLWFEMMHKWTGALVEPNPVRFPKGYTANRKAWGAPFCLATKDHPHISPFSVQTIKGGMSGLLPEHDDESYDLQCFPLYSLILALGNPTINYFSLDIEGAEFMVLQSLPWDRVDIEVIAIELAHAGKVFPGSREEVHQFMEEKGYIYVGTIEIDDVFVRHDLSDGKYKIDFRAANEFQHYFFKGYKTYIRKDEL